MAANYMGTGLRLNTYARGLRFPAMKLGAFSMNVVLQASACCGENAENYGMLNPGGLVLATPEPNTKSQKRLGILGVMSDSGTGLHRRNQFQGFSEALELRPQIIGFVFKEGKVTLYRNGAKVNTYVAHSTAVQTFEWINGWIDEETESRGQLAEVKLYNQAFSDSIMLRLQRLLDCKWGISGAQGSEWSTCENAGGTDGVIPPKNGKGILRLAFQARGSAASSIESTISAGGGSPGGTGPGPFHSFYLSEPLTRDGDGNFDVEVSAVANLVNDSPTCQGPLGSFTYADLYYTHPDFPGAAIPFVGTIDGGTVVRNEPVPVAPDGQLWGVTISRAGDSVCVPCGGSDSRAGPDLVIEGYFDVPDGSRDYVSLHISQSTNFTDPSCTSPIGCPC